MEINTIVDAYSLANILGKQEHNKGGLWKTKYDTVEYPWMKQSI